MGLWDTISDVRHFLGKIFFVFDSNMHIETLLTCTVEFALIAWKDFQGLVPSHSNKLADSSSDISSSKVISLSCLFICIIAFKMTLLSFNFRKKNLHFLGCLLGHSSFLQSVALHTSATCGYVKAYTQPRQKCTCCCWASSRPATSERVPPSAWQ